MHRVDATTNARVPIGGRPACRPNSVDGGGSSRAARSASSISATPLVIAGGTVVARQELRRVLKDRYDVGLATIGDPDLADQQP